jgi:8-amino-7-oxononanoate synthase
MHMTQSVWSGRPGLRSKGDVAGQGKDGSQTVVVTDDIWDRGSTFRSIGYNRRLGNMLVMDEAHAVGILGSGGRGTTALFDVGLAASSVLTGTFSKALGGACRDTLSVPGI